MTVVVCDAVTTPARCAIAMLVSSAACVVDDPQYLGPPGASTSGPTDGGPTTATPTAAPDTGTASDPTATDGTGPTSTRGTGPDDPSDTSSTDATSSDTTDGCPGWWDPQWAHRHRLVLDDRGQAEDLEAFTVLVTLDAATFDYALTKPGGTDLRFVDDDGTTELPYHIEHWDPAGTSQVWVRVDRIDAAPSEDYLWLYHGNEAAPSVLDPAGSYDEHHQGVWHLHETAGPHIDSAAGTVCTWLDTGTGTQDAAGQIDGANDFDGDGINCGQGSIADATSFTLTAWVRMPLTGNPNQSIVSLESIRAPRSGQSLYIRRSDGAVGTWHDGGYAYAVGVAVSPAQWAFVALRGEQDPARGSIEVSVDGEPWQPLVAGDTTDLQLAPGTPLFLGQWPGRGPNTNARGTIDEVRISSVARSDAWIRAQYLAARGLLVIDEGDQVVCR